MMASGDPDEFEAGPVPAGMFSESMDIDEANTFVDMVSQDLESNGNCQEFDDVALNPSDEPFHHIGELDQIEQRPSLKAIDIT